MLKVYVAGVGILGPGLDGWKNSRLILAGGSPYAVQECRRPQPSMLASTERRRASATVRLGLQVAQEAVEQSGLQSNELATVFASSDGDTEIIDYLCDALAAPDKIVSPTRFHNSVHNAPAGYWSIAAKSLAPANSLSCYGATFAAGLLEAACQATVEDRPVLLSVYDIAAPEPLCQARPLHVPFGAALVLDCRPSAGTVSQLSIGYHTQCSAPESTITTPQLEDLRCGNPAARSLPLLAAIARNEPAEVMLDYVAGNCVRVEISP